jgi:hypothetical protein
MQNNADKITLAYEKLRKSMPSIGILSRKKRIKAYIEITNIVDYTRSYNAGFLYREGCSHEAHSYSTQRMRAAFPVQKD